MAAPQKVSPEQIKQALTDCRGSVQEAARKLGVAKGSLYKRMAKAGINPNDYRNMALPPAAKAKGDAMGDVSDTSAMADTSDVVNVSDRASAPQCRTRRIRRRGRHGGPATMSDTSDPPAWRTRRVQQSTESTSVTFTPRAPRPYIPTVQSPIEVESDIELRSGLRESRHLSLRPDIYRAIDDAVIKLISARRDRRLTPSRLVEEFFDARFAQWLAEAAEESGEGREKVRP